MIAKLKDLANNNTIRFALIAVVGAIVVYLVFDFLLLLILSVAWLCIAAVLAENEAVIEEHKVPTVKESAKQMKAADDRDNQNQMPPTPKLDKKRKKPKKP